MSRTKNNFIGDFLGPLGMIFFPFLVLFIFLVLPEIVATNQTKHQTQWLLNTHQAYKLGYDAFSVKYLKQHPTLKLTDVSDNQGSYDNWEYHLGQTANGQKLGLIIIKKYPGVPYSKITIHSIRVWHNHPS